MTMHPGHPGNYPGEDQDRVLCSLLVPCRDEAASVEACLDSLAASPLPARATWDEWIIVDDASSDTTAERVKGWASTHPELPVRLRVNVERFGKAAILEAVRARLTGSSWGC
jgi:glycosyltransferase involved in cell wall biosynthesis